MKRLALAAALAALAIPPALASDAPEPKADGRWRGNFTLGLSYSAGNTDETTASLAGEAARATAQGKLGVAATARAGRSRQGGVESTTAELYKLGGRYDRNLATRHFAFAGLDLEHDGLQQLDLRSTANAGLGWHVIKGGDDTLDVFAGVGATRENYEAFTREFAEVVLGEESRHRISGAVTLRQKLAVYRNLEDSGEYRAAVEAGLATAIAAGWTFNVALTSRYVSNPLPGLDRTDTLLLVGVGGSFGP